ATRRTGARRPGSRRAPSPPRSWSTSHGPRLAAPPDRLGHGPPGSVMVHPARSWPPPGRLAGAPGLARDEPARDAAREQHERPDDDQLEHLRELVRLEREPRHHEAEPEVVR